MSDFAAKSFDDGSWSLAGDATVDVSSPSVVKLTSGPKTDWWKTAVGASPESDVDRRSGPLYSFEVDAKREFRVGVWLRGKWISRFQQGTLFVHAGPEVGKADQNWLKCGIEYEEEKQFLGSVVASPFSDWSILPAAQSTSTAASDGSWVWMQIARHGPDMILRYSFHKFAADQTPSGPPAEEDLVLLREVKGFNQFLADGSKPTNDTWRVGVMTCGPLSDSAEADYAGFHFGYTE